MRLARNGNAQFEVNSGLLEGTSKEHAQGDPKSSFGFNVSSGPLNHYLSMSPEVPEFHHAGKQPSPILFAADNYI